MSYRPQFSLVSPSVITAVARELCGEPNAALSRSDEHRFGTNGSLSIDTRKWAFYDYEAGEGGGVCELVMLRLKLKKQEAQAWLVERGHAFWKERMPSKLVATYNYPDSSGTLRFQVLRFEPKRFTQRRPDGNGGWIGNLDGVTRLLYRLPAVVAAVAAGQPVVFVEGEKDADRLAGMDFCATTKPGGSRLWHPSMTDHLKGAHVVLVPDNDLPGERHMQQIAENIQAVVASLRVLQLRDHWEECPLKGDVSDWLDHGGGTHEQLSKLLEESPEWTTSRMRDHNHTMDPSPSVTHPASEMEEATDIDLADLFASTHESEFRYCAEQKRWLCFDGRVWLSDNTNVVLERVKRLCQEQAKRESRGRRHVASAKTVNSVKQLATADRRLVATVDQWDANSFLLNTPDGVVDLTTGETRRHSLDDYMTKITAVSPHGECPLWIEFLERILGEDPENIAFMRRVVGYCLTGATTEQAMFFAYGKGANGKSVFLETIAGILGGYAKTAPIETFTASSTDRHLTELAWLDGPRLVTSSETEPNRRWAESRIKTLTGGDRITARLMRQDPFQFRPKFKLLIAGNHMPSVHAVDEAIRRRFHVLPFDVTIPTDQRDAKLSDKLKEEWPGILQWAIGGCLEWQRMGLCVPQAVAEATADYLCGEDSLGAWLDECCEDDAHASETPARLYESWKEYTRRHGEQTGSGRPFWRQLEARGYRKHKTKAGRSYVGLRLKSEAFAATGDGCDGSGD